eukprot:SAG31_NODE_202_length_20512_cov_62.659237_2_plen_57_part_00
MNGRAGWPDRIYGVPDFRIPKLYIAELLQVTVLLGEGRLLGQQPVVIQHSGAEPKG